MKRRSLGRSGFQVAPLVFGANVFGWTVDQPTAFRLLDRFVDSGLNAIDTADVYSRWVPGNKGGESEAMIGNWLHASPSRRSQVVLITKVGMAPGGLSSQAIVTAAEGSLRRLQTDHIDLYLSHKPDPATPIEETLRAYESLIRAGKVRAIGSSNTTPESLRQALSASAGGLPRYEVEQPEYNLYTRKPFESGVRDLCLKEEVGVIVYYSLASGFLSGKYRSRQDGAKSARGSGAVEKYLNDRGLHILAALDQVAAGCGASLAEVALAWLIAREGVTAPIASATTVEQVDSLARAARLTLPRESLDALTAASEPAGS